MPDVNEETLQRIGQARWGLDAPAALRLATGINLDMQGIARALGGLDTLIGVPTDTLEEILSETSIVGGPKVTPATAGWTSRILSADSGSIALGLDSAGQYNMLNPTAAVAHTSNTRWAWQHPSLTGLNWEVTFLCAPQNTNVNPGSGAIFVQEGVGVRYQIDTTPDPDRQSLILANNNIAYGSSVMNYSVWSSNVDGTSFLNRQASSGAAFTNPPFPYWCKFRLTGVTMETWIWGLNESFPLYQQTNRYKLVNLDTDAGSTAGNLTPTLAGALVLVGAHIGNSPLSEAKFPYVFARVLD